MPNTIDSKETKKQDKSDFKGNLVACLFAIAAVAIPAYALHRHNESTRQNNFPLTETEKINSSLIAQIDFFDLNTKNPEVSRFFPEGFNENDFYKKYGLNNTDFTKNPYQLLSIVPKTKEDTETFMKLVLLNIFKGHGETVNKVMQNTNNNLLNSNGIEYANTISAIPAIDIESITIDELGNPIMRIKVDQDIISEKIKNIPQKVINLSLEVGHYEFKVNLYKAKPKPYFLESSSQISVVNPDGTVKEEGKNNITVTYYDADKNEINKEEYEKLMIIYESNVKTELLDPNERSIDYRDFYDSIYVETNIQRLNLISFLNPDKILVVAGGNRMGIDLPDIRNIRNKLKSENIWGNNLILVGYEIEYHGQIDYVGPSVLGNDIYVSNKLLLNSSTTGASSFATPIVTELIEFMRSKANVDDNNILSTLLELTVEKDTYDADGNLVKYNVLDLQKVQEWIYMQSKVK